MIVNDIFRHILVRLVVAILDLILLAPFSVFAALCRFIPKRYDVGIGPIPLISSIYHKQSLEKFGYHAQTFVDSVWHHTESFDVRADLYFPGFARVCRPYFLFLRAVLTYRCLYIYFDGGPLRVTTLLCLAEPVLLRLANVRTVVMAFGADVHVLTRTNNFLFIHGMAKDYPAHRFQRRRVARKIDTWTRHADHIIAGVDWVEYLYYWNTLCLGHFPIDTERWTPPSAPRPLDQERPLRLVHAVNHRHLKGTQDFIRAVDDLKAEGIPVELKVLEDVSNEVVKEAIEEADVVADQLIVGWYAMFSIEAMAMGKPTICYIRPDLKTFYMEAEILERDELPIVEATVSSVKDVIRDLAQDRERLPGIGQKSRDFVLRHHSIEAIGSMFDRINRSLDIEPRP
jgi:glycosyltransferase involved in cell wall biosynthesis